MTPKEKAIETVNTIEKEILSESKWISWGDVKRRAIDRCNSTLLKYKNYSGIEINKQRVEYWEQVKTEIPNL